MAAFRRDGELKRKGSVLEQRAWHGGVFLEVGFGWSCYTETGILRLISFCND